ncbi:MAG: hypothetical protein ABSA67_13770 [Candidatus Brocadiia bacterium]|jgi:hypothetical protein
MNASATIKQHPWAFSLALAIVACSLADVSLALRLRSAGVERGQHRDRVRAMETLADEFRALKAQSGVAGQTLPPGVHLTPNAVTAIAKDRGIADRITTMSASPARYDERIQEQIIDLALISVTREDLALFLHAVEQIAPAVRTKELRITPSAAGGRAGQTALIDAHVQISAYETTARLSK